MKTTKSLILGTVSSLLLSLVATAQDTNIELDKYQLDVNDCETCPPVADINSEAEFIDYINDASAAARVNANNAFGARTNFRTRFRDRNTQIVHLDFDPVGEPTFPVCRIDANGNQSLFGVFNDHVYTQAEKDEIQARIEADYDQFGFYFTQDAPPSDIPFTTVQFNLNDAPLDCSESSNVRVTANGGVRVLFGRANGIDFGNENKNDFAFADASIWEFLGQLRNGQFFQAFSNIDVNAEFGGNLTDAISFAVTGQSANTGAHELGHTLGLRHQNSFGAPGDGLPSTNVVSPFDFVPTFDGPSNADETILHTMASGISVGLPFDGGVNLDRFFSERSAIRLTANVRKGAITTSEANADSQLGLRRLLVPNTIIEGDNADELWDIKARVINGSISVPGEVDTYTFQGRQGEFFNAEVVPYFAQNQTFADSILAQILIFKVDLNGNETFLGGNARSFESAFDTEVFDFELPEDGTYSVKIIAPDVFFADFDGDGTIDSIPLTATTDGAQLLTGDYKLFAFKSDFNVEGRELIRLQRRTERAYASRFSYLANR